MKITTEFPPDLLQNLVETLPCDNAYCSLLYQLVWHVCYNEYQPVRGVCHAEHLASDVGFEERQCQQVWHQTWFLGLRGVHCWCLLAAGVGGCAWNLSGT